MLRAGPLLVLAAITLLVGGCDIANSDPFDQPGTWKATGVNDANLRAMVANPNDLVAGHGERGSSAILANAGATRLYSDKLKPLIKVQASNFGGGGGGDSGGGGTSTGLGASGGGNQQ